LELIPLGSLTKRAAGRPSASKNQKLATPLDRRLSGTEAPMNFSDKLRALTADKSRIQLAKAAGVPRQAIQDHIRKGFTPTARRALVIANALGVSVDWLIDDRQGMPPVSRALSPSDVTKAVQEFTAARAGPRSAQSCSVVFRRLRSLPKVYQDLVPPTGNEKTLEKSALAVKRSFISDMTVLNATSHGQPLDNEKRTVTPPDVRATPTRSKGERRELAKSAAARGSSPDEASKVRARFVETRSVRLGPIARECPFCRKHFKALQRHLLREHPQQLAAMPDAVFA
jgi:hypothetical protein